MPRAAERHSRNALRPHLRLVWGAIAGLAIMIALADAQANAARSRAQCPTHLSNTLAALNADAALSAARRLLPKVYLGSTGRVVQLLWLQPQRPELPGAPYWRAIAQRRCGATVANQSWMVAAIFPQSKIAVPSTGVFFIVLTKSGWVAWHRYR